jgi:hypothetical protein
MVVWAAGWSAAVDEQAFGGATFGGATFVGVPVGDAAGERAGPGPDVGLWADPTGEPAGVATDGSPAALGVLGRPPKVGAHQRHHHGQDEEENDSASHDGSLSAAQPDSRTRSANDRRRQA